MGHIVRYAKQKARSNSHSLDGTICYEAVAVCLRRQHPQIGPVTVQQHDHLVSLDEDPMVNLSFGRVPVGAAIGFFAPLGGVGPVTLVHAVVSLGHGEVAGSNNGCIGVTEVGFCRFYPHDYLQADVIEAGRWRSYHDGRAFDVRYRLH